MRLDRHLLAVALLSIVCGALCAGSVPATTNLVGWGGVTWEYVAPVAHDIPDGVFTSVSAGSGHAVAIRTDGTLVAWGDNTFGQIDNVPSGTFTAVAAGHLHSIAIRGDGTLAAWGHNRYGECDVPGGTFTTVAADNFYSLAVRTDGMIAAWGHLLPGFPILPDGAYTAVAAGGLGDYWDWAVGLRTDNRLAISPYSWEGLSLPSGTFTAVAVGSSHGLAIRTDGTLAAWGQTYSIPAGTFSAIAAANNWSIGLRTDGTLVAGGDSNEHGQLNVPSGTFTTVAAGGNYGLALRPIPEPSSLSVLTIALGFLAPGTMRRRWR